MTKMAIIKIEVNSITLIFFNSILKVDVIIKLL